LNGTFLFHCFPEHSQLLDSTLVICVSWVWFVYRPTLKGPLWVRMRRTHIEHMLSAFPPNSDLIADILAGPLRADIVAKVAKRAL